MCTYHIFIEGGGLSTRKLLLAASNERKDHSTPASPKIATTDTTMTQPKRV
jgi:hypothetical protein